MHDESKHADFAVVAFDEEESGAVCFAQGEKFLLFDSRLKERNKELHVSLLAAVSREPASANDVSNKHDIKKIRI